MKTRLAPRVSFGSACRATRKCERRLTAMIWSQVSALVPSSLRPAPIPTLSTTPSSPPSASAASSTSRSHWSASDTSAVTVAAVPPLSSTSRAVSSAASGRTSTTATAAPPRAASTEIAWPLPGGASGSPAPMLPPPTTRILRPSSRAAAGALPAAVAGSSCSSLITPNCKVAAMALIPYGDEDPQDERVREVLARLPEPRINLFTMLANAPALIGPTLRLGEAILTRSDLDVVLRELAILHTARLTDTEYEWVQHEAIARLVGIEEEKIRAVERGEIEGEPFEERESLALSIVGEVAGGGTPSEELVKRAEAELGRSELLELLIVAGYYAMLGGVMRAVRLDVDSVVEKGMLDRDRLGGAGGTSASG